MSRRNKVNPDHYTAAGRLSPDDLARERKKQAEQLFSAAKGRQSKPVPPWMANEAPPAEPQDGTPQPQEPVTTQADISPEQSPQAKPHRTGKRKEQAARAAGSKQTKADKKTIRRKRASTKAATSMGTTRGAASTRAKRRTTPKAAGAAGTPRTKKSGRAQSTKAKTARATTSKKTVRKTAKRGMRRAKSR